MDGQQRWKKYRRKLAEVVFTCIETRRRICGQESDGDGGARKKEEEEDRSVGGRITSRTTCRRDSCQERKCKAGLNGGVS